MIKLSIVALLAVTGLASAQTVLVDFDPPAFPLGPSTFAAAGPEQVLNVAGTATISGGVILGFPTSFPAIPFATAPNLYGTADPNVGAHASLDPVMTISIDPMYSVDQVEGVLFNGLIVPRTFTVEAYSGLTLVEQNNIVLQSNQNSGFTTFSLNHLPITTVRIFDQGAVADGQWDFFIDTLVFNGEVPAPGAMALLGLGGLVAARRRRA